MEGGVLCRCGLPAKVICSWKADNPGRRRFCCPRSSSRSECGCDFFKWLDNPISDWAKVLILGLLRSKCKLDEEVDYLRGVARNLKYTLFVCIIVIFMNWLNSAGHGRGGIG